MRSSTNRLSSLLTRRAVAGQRREVRRASAAAGSTAPRSSACRPGTDPTAPRGAAPPSAAGRRGVSGRMRREQHQVGRVAVEHERVDVRELGAQRRQDRAQRIAVDRVQREPGDQRGRPALSARRAAAKNSRVNRFATPVSHGFDGSEMITSYFVARRLEVVAGVVEHHLHARVVERLRVHVLEEARRLEHRRLELDRVDRARPPGWRAAEPTVTPDAQPITSTLRGGAPNSIAACAEQHLRRHVVAGRRVGLAVQVQRALRRASRAPRPSRTGRRGSRGAPRARRPRAGSRPAIRRRCARPRSRQRERARRRATAGAARSPARAAAGAAASASRRRGRSLPRHSSSAAPAARFTAIASAAGAAQAERRQQHEAGEERARRRADRVHEVDVADRGRRRPRASACARASSGNSAPSTNAGGNITAIATRDLREQRAGRDDAPKLRTSAMKRGGQVRQQREREQRQHAQHRDAARVRDERPAQAVGQRAARRASRARSRAGTPRACTRRRRSRSPAPSTARASRPPRRRATVKPTVP